MKYIDKTSSLIDFGDYDKASFKYNYLQDTQTINGVLCHKAIIDCMAENTPQQIQVWYSKEKKLNLSGFDYILSNLEGFPIKIIYREFLKIKMVSSADLVINCELNVTNFNEEITEEMVAIKEEEKYQLLNKEEMTQTLLSMAGMKRNKALKPKGEAIESVVKGADGTEVKLTKYNPFKLNETLQPFKAKTLQGGEISFSDFKDKVVVLNFWFLQCKPCIDEMPMLNKLKDQFNNKAEFISITYETANAVTNFFKTHDFNFIAIIDAQHLIDLYGVSTYPATVVIDKKGIIRFIQIGGVKNLDELTSQIEYLVE